MKRPSFQFYPGDWKLNLKLRRCSLLARGAWVEILCILHDNEDEYGVARFPLTEVASTAGVPLEAAEELVAKDVLKGSDDGSRQYVYRPRHGRVLGEPVLLVDPHGGPCWFSSRMVEDEYRRSRQGANSRFTPAGGANPSPARRAPKGANPAPSRAPSPSPNSSPSQWQGERPGDGSTSPSPSSLNPTGSISVAKATAAPSGGSFAPSGAGSADGRPDVGSVSGASAGGVAEAPRPPAAPIPPGRSSRRPVAPADGPAGPPPRVRPMTPLTAEEVRKRDVWRAAKDVLDLDGVPEAQKGTFLGQLLNKCEPAGLGGDASSLDRIQARFEVFAAAIDAATKVGGRPAGGIREYLTGTVQHLVGQRERVANRQAALEAGNDAELASWLSKNGKELAQ